MIAGAVKQFWSETLWQDIDYMFVDMPPGTGDVPLDCVPVPAGGRHHCGDLSQELVGMIVTKAVNMAKKMDIPILGVVENMSYLNARTAAAGSACSARAISRRRPQPRRFLCWLKIPIQPDIAQAVDGGRVEYLDAPWFEGAVKAVENL